MDSWRSRTYGSVYAGVYDDWYSEGGRLQLSGSGSPLEVANAIAALVAELGGRSVLELGIGTGRLALPLVERGLEVTGLDSSVEMLDVLSTKPDADRLKIVIGDMANPCDGTHLAEASFCLVFIGFNTLFCLTTRESQASCLAGAAHLLEPGGYLVIEAFVPDPNKYEGLSVRAIEAGAVFLDVAKMDPETQEIHGQRVEVTSAGNRLFPYHLRYSTPDELDVMAAAAGLTVNRRWEDWSGKPFNETSPTHISIWVKPDTEF